MWRNRIIPLSDITQPIQEFLRKMRNYKIKTATEKGERREEDIQSRCNNTQGTNTDRRRIGTRRRAWNKLWRRWERGWRHIEGYGWSKDRMLGGNRGRRNRGQRIDEEEIRKTLEREIKSWEEKWIKERFKEREDKGKTREKANKKIEGEEGEKHQGKEGIKGGETGGTIEKQNEVWIPDLTEYGIEPNPGPVLVDTTKLRYQGEWRYDIHTISEILEKGDWTIIPLRREIIKEMTIPVTRVWKKEAGEWAQWVIVMQSAALHEINIVEKGLYAWKQFEENETIGEYTGEIIGERTYDTSIGRENEAKERAIAKHQDLHGNNRRMLVEIEVQGGRRWEVKVIDGENEGPPFLTKANDARKIKTVTNTAYMEPGGKLKGGKRKIGGKEAWQYCKITKWTDLANNEILWAYGKRYWDRWGQAKSAEEIEEEKLLRETKKKKTDDINKAREKESKRIMDIQQIAKDKLNSERRNRATKKGREAQATNIIQRQAGEAQPRKELAGPQRSRQEREDEKEELELNREIYQEVETQNAEMDTDSQNEEEDKEDEHAGQVREIDDKDNTVGDGEMDRNRRSEVTDTEEGDTEVGKGKEKEKGRGEGGMKRRQKEDKERGEKGEREIQEKREEEGELAGLLFAEIAKTQRLTEGINREGKNIFITELLVDEKQRKKGWATRMLKYIMEMEPEAEEVHLIVKTSGGRTEAARKWYNELGFREYEGDEKIKYTPNRDGDQPEKYMYAETRDLMGKIREREKGNEEKGEKEEITWGGGTGKRQGEWRLGIIKGKCRQKKDIATWQEREAVKKIKSRHNMEGADVWKECMPQGIKESRCVYGWKEITREKESKETREEGGGKRKEKRKQDRKRGARWLAINVCGIHCTRRKEGDHEEIQEAGRKTLRLVESSKLRDIMDIMTRARETVDLAILADTHLDQQEMEDVIEILWKEAGLRAAGSPRTSELETEGEKAGVMIVWDPEEVGMETEDGEYKIEEVVKGRVVRMEAYMERSKIEVAIYGVYMPVRHWRKDRVLPSWEELDRALSEEKRANIIMGGDWNAELREYREKRGAKGEASPADRELQGLVDEYGMTGQARGATYRAGTQIDNWFVNEELAGSMGTAETLIGVCGDDHKGVVAVHYGGDKLGEREERITYSPAAKIKTEEDREKYGVTLMKKFTERVWPEEEEADKLLEQLQTMLHAAAKEAMTEESEKKEPGEEETEKKVNSLPPNRAIKKERCRGKVAKWEKLIIVAEEWRGNQETKRKKWKEIKIREDEEYKAAKTKEDRRKRAIEICIMERDKAREEFKAVDEAVGDRLIEKFKKAVTQDTGACMYELFGSVREAIYTWSQPKHESKSTMEGWKPRGGNNSNGK